MKLIGNRNATYKVPFLMLLFLVRDQNLCIAGFNQKDLKMYRTDINLEMSERSIFGFEINIEQLKLCFHNIIIQVNAFQELSNHLFELLN